MIEDICITIDRRRRRVIPIVFFLFIPRLYGMLQYSMHLIYIFAVEESSRPFNILLCDSFSLITS